MPDGSAVLVVAPNWLGDAVMALPALADIRRAHPRAAITVAARASIAPLYDMVPGVDRRIVLRWRGSALERRFLREDIVQVQSANAEVAILLPNSFAAAWAIRRAGVGQRWGYASDLRRPLLTRAVRRPRRSLHQALYYQHLVRQLGMPNGDLDPVIDVPETAIEGAIALLAERRRDVSRPLLVVAPGAAYGTAKRWLPAHFGALLTGAIRAGAQAALVGTAGDRDTAHWVITMTDAVHRNDVFDLTGATTLQTLAGVMSLAATCVSNDSGAMHLAAAVGTPLAALFGPTRDHETAPLTRKAGRAEVLVNPVWCRPCMLRECPIDHRCMTGLRPERVLASVRTLMESSG